MNWTEVGHLVRGVEEVFDCGDSVGRWRQEQHVINVQQQNYWCVLLSRLLEFQMASGGSVRSVKVVLAES